MALTKVITGVTDLNQAQSTNGLKFPTGSVFAGTPEKGMIRNDQSQSSETSSSAMQFYNGTAWKNFVNKTPCTTDNAAFPITNLAYYKLNNNANDSSGNSYNGTTSNVTYAAGKFDDAAAFNGSSSYITLPTNFLNSSTQTISAWVNPSSVSANGVIYSSYDYQTGPSKGTYIRVSSGGIVQLTVHDGDCGTMYPADPNCTGVTQLVSPSAIPTNTWTHIVGVIGGSGNPMTIYINGVNVVSTPTMRSVGYWSGKQPLIGAQSYVVNGTSYGPETFFNGSIDQIRIFSSALNAAQVTQLYNELQC